MIPYKERVIGTVNLYTSYYPEKSKKRHIEIIECLKKNLNCFAIDNVYLILEKVDSPPIENKKLKIKYTDKRPTYNHFIQWANENHATQNDLSIIANSDIYFGSDLLLLAQYLKQNQCAALSRWDIKHGDRKLLLDRNDSQDSWVFRGSIRNVQGNFQVGIPRCDNRFLYELKQAGYEVINPSLSIRSYHLHDGIREEYANNDNLNNFVPPPYAYIWPHNLWSLHRTLTHNILNPKKTLLWQVDKNKLSSSLVARIYNKILKIFRSK